MTSIFAEIKQNQSLQHKYNIYLRLGPSCATDITLIAIVSPYANGRI